MTAGGLQFRPANTAAPLESFRFRLASASLPPSVIGRLTACNASPAVLTLGSVPVDAGLVSVETATGRPLAEMLDRLGRSDGYRNDVLRCLTDRHVQQCCQPTAASDLST